MAMYRGGGFSWFLAAHPEIPPFLRILSINPLPECFRVFTGFPRRKRDHTYQSHHLRPLCSCKESARSLYLSRMLDNISRFKVFIQLLKHSVCAVCGRWSAGYFSTDHRVQNKPLHLRRVHHFWYWYQTVHIAICSVEPMILQEFRPFTGSSSFPFAGTKLWFFTPLYSDHDSDSFYLSVPNS